MVQSRGNRLPRVIVVAAFAVLGLSACVYGGGAVSEKQANLANQRKAAVALLDVQGGVEKITFTREGGTPGLGASWRANAVISIGGSEYQAILSTNPAIDITDPLPAVLPEQSPMPVSVTYSDGSSEVIE